jgi:hypothetical protein
MQGKIGIAAYEARAFLRVFYDPDSGHNSNN